MADEYVLSEPLRSFGLALKPLLQRLRLELTAPAAPTVPLDDPGATVLRHLGQLSRFAGRLETVVAAIDAEVLDNPQAGVTDAWHAVGRLGGCLDDLVDGLREARSLRASGSAAPVPTLLAGAHRHLLAEVAEWLDRIEQALADPAAEVARQGSVSSGPPELRLALRPTPPPQLAALRAWVQRQASPGLGFWGHVGALMLGWGLAGLLFGDDCDC